MVRRATCSIAGFLLLFIVIVMFLVTILVEVMSQDFPEATTWHQSNAYSAEFAIPSLLPLNGSKYPHPDGFVDGVQAG